MTELVDALLAELIKLRAELVAQRARAERAETALARYGARGTDTPPRGRPEDAHRGELHRLIETGDLPAHPTATAIQRALSCRRETACRLRDELADTGE